MFETFQTAFLVLHINFAAQILKSDMPHTPA